MIIYLNYAFLQLTGILTKIQWSWTLSVPWYSCRATWYTASKTCRDLLLENYPFIGQ